MDQMMIDVQNWCFIWCGYYYMGIVNFFVKSFGF